MNVVNVCLNISSDLQKKNVDNIKIKNGGRAKQRWWLGFTQKINMNFNETKQEFTTEYAKKVE